MDKKTTIEYMRKAVACHHEVSTACLGRNCCDCPHDYPVDTIELIESALKLLEDDLAISALEKQSRIITVTDAEGGLLASISDKDIIEENGVHVIISEE